MVFFLFCRYFHPFSARKTGVKLAVKVLCFTEISRSVQNLMGRPPRGDWQIFAHLWVSHKWEYMCV